MPDSLRKAPFHCPHCGFVQHEPPHLISTYCRSCGSYYEVAGQIAPQAASGQGGRLQKTLRQIVSRPPRQVSCHHCGESHEVSGYAKNTICSGCNAAIQLEDIVVSSNVSRPIDTRGKLTIQKGGSLSGALTICGDAVIEGKINGALICEGTLRLACHQKLGNSIKAKAVIIERDADIEILQPVHTHELMVEGRVHGTFECTGRTRISKRGILEGRLTARAVIVDRGGSLLAESSIRPIRPPENSPGQKTLRNDQPFGGENPLPA